MMATIIDINVSIDELEERKERDRAWWEHYYLPDDFSQARDLIRSDTPAGRKLEFLVQELNREINTIGSKSQHAGIASTVVDLKAELERIREQVQNVE